MSTKRLVILSLCSALIAQTAHAVTIDTVPIDNPGNANDPLDGDYAVPGVHFGAVAYNYRIDKYDVTVGQYTEFLNAVAANDTYSLYNPSMGTNLNIAGIARSGVPGSYTYSVIGSPNHPITYVSWGDAARFSNWLNNGQSIGAEGPFTTETGAYTLNGAITDDALNAVTRNAVAKWFIPTENEWYKAAYYDPVAGRYWYYATGTDAPPSSAPPGSMPNTANFYDYFSTGYAVTGSASIGTSQNYLTDVGAYAASASPYGTFDQSGNVYEWNEALIGELYRGFRGGAWDIFLNFMPANARDFNAPSIEYKDIGFRVATVPESSTGMLAVFAVGAMWVWIKRFNS